MEPFRMYEPEGAPAVFRPENWVRKFPFLETGFSSRKGGVSAPPYSALNCGLHVNDLAEHVVRNRQLLASSTRLPFEAWTFAEQVHGRQVSVVTRSERGAGRCSRETALPSADALVTNERGICLCALFADCVPLYFFDPVGQVIGLAHAGWKGSVLKIAVATVETMAHTFGSRPRDLLAAIGPSIGKCCYEVDEKVIREVDNVISELKLGADRSSSGDEPEIYNIRANGKYMLDLQQFNRQIMIKAGIIPSNIEVSKLCTACRPEWFFSHRKEKGKTGRMAAWIGMV